MSAFQSKFVIALYLAIGLLSVGAVQAAPSASSDQKTIAQLQKQVADLSKELARLKETTGPQAQHQAMQQHWQMMQEHMRTMGQMPGMMAGDRGHAQMMDHGMMGKEMMGKGMGAGPGMKGWALPPGMTPQTYRQQMSGHMQAMRAQMAAISAEKDPEKRQALMREHHDAMYRDMQAMRGMGWMWAPQGTLPDAGSKGAKLVSTYCSQCHAPPSPSLHTGKEWAELTPRMRAHIKLARSGTGTGVKEPTVAEMDAILKYLGEHAR